MQSRMRITADQRLFDEWRKLGEDIHALSSIVQNDNTVERRLFAQWKFQAEQLKMKMERLTMSTVLHIGRCNGP